MKNSIYELADSYETTTTIVSEKYDEAHEMLKTFAEERSYDCIITVDEGEVYLENCDSEWFEENAQTIFDDYVSDLLSSIA